MTYFPYVVYVVIRKIGACLYEIEKKQISTEKWTSRDDTVTTNVTEMLTYTILSSPVTTTAKNTVSQEKARRYRFSAVLWVETLGRSGRHRGGRLAMRSD